MLSFIRFDSDLLSSFRTGFFLARLGRPTAMEGLDYGDIGLGSFFDGDIPGGGAPPAA